MEDLLTPVSISYNTSRQEAEHTLVEVPKSHEAISDPILPSTPAAALEILKSEPDYDTLMSTLRYLCTDSLEFRITSPSPLAAQLVHVLVSDIVPNYWSVLYKPPNSKSSKSKTRAQSRNGTDIELFLSCLRSVLGLNAILLSLKQLIQKSKESKKTRGASNTQDLLKTLLQLITALLEGDEIIQMTWKSIRNTSDSPSKQKTLWHEYLSLAGGEKILGIAAEADYIINELSSNFGEKYWVADGNLYSSWLSRNIICWVRSLPPDSEDEWNNCGELLSKSFRLGYTEHILQEIFTSLLLRQRDYNAQFTRLLRCLPGFEQRNVLYAFLKLLASDYLSNTVISEDDSRWWEPDAGKVSAAAKLISIVIDGDEHRKNQLVTWLTSSSGAGIGDGIAIRRAAVAVLSGDKKDVEVTLEKSLQQFGDQLYIRHTPTLQQEVHVQVLLLSAGYMQRKAPLRLAMMMRSGSHLSVVSNRLAASSPRARFLGMVVGEALSDLVDKGDKKMDFKMEEMSSPEAKWYKGLVRVSDTVGSLEPFKPGLFAPKPKKTDPRITQKAEKSPEIQGGTKVIAIEEIDDDVDNEEISDDDRLIPYARPDSDPEDSDEDPTLITRNKPTAPVYIRDLIKYLRDTENYDQQKLALSTASQLIRRKANFGTEVSSHAEELATLLVGLQDKYDITNFQEMRLQGMIAILVAQPLPMGQWFSKTFFDGDYSISQRASILTTLGIGARELGGFGSEDSNLTGINTFPSASFPSKSLPRNMRRLYDSATTEPTPLDELSTQLSQTMIAPMAAELADKITGPSILKVRTFSSRMAVEKKRKKPVANTLAKIVADGFFFPLTGRFFVHLKAYGSSRSNVAFQPYLLALFIKTLSLLIHASGPSTLSLPQMTSEFWDLLLSLRTHSIGDITIMEALLFGFLTILDINEDKRRLVEAHGREMLETQEWVEGVFERVGAGGSEEDDKVRMLAAACLVRIREVVEKFQALLMGDLTSF